MIPFAFLLFVVISCVVAHYNWRLGLFLMLIAGVLQDPVRKLMMGAPGYMVLAFVPIWFVICAKLFLANPRLWNGFERQFRLINQRMVLLILTLLLAFVVLIMNYGLGAWKVGIIGAIGYVFPLLAMVAGFYLIKSSEEFGRMVWGYAIFTSLVLLGGWMEYLGAWPNWKALGTDTLGMTWIRHVPGYIVKLNSGFFRSPDLLGWHSAVLVMLSTVMIYRAKWPVNRIVWMLFAVWGAMTVLISGRNKMIFMPMVFLGIIAMAFIYKSSINRLATIALSLLCAGLIFLGVFLQVSLDREYTRYVSYGTGYASERLTDSTIGAVVTTFRQSGFFGEGLGTASLGKRFAGNTNVATWQESGLSRLMVELGVMGFIAAALFVMGVMWTFYRMMKFMPRGSPLLPIYAGMMGILAANGASFIISHQIFGDPFIIILTGLLVGITLSVPFWPNGQLGGGAGS